MDDQLKACPFCPNGDLSVYPNDHAIDGGSMGIPRTDAFYAHCEGCGCDGPVEDSHSKAVVAWNTRAQAEDGEAVAEIVQGDKVSHIFPVFKKGFYNLPVGTKLYTHPPRAEGDGEDASDAARYNYLLDCEVTAAREYLPNLDADAFKTTRRAKHDSAIAALSAQRGEADHV